MTRGDFTTSDIYFSGTLYPDTYSDKQIKVANGIPDSYSTGYDYTLYNGGGSQTLTGNYGVFYKFSYYIPSWTSAHRVFIGINPRGGNSRPAIWATRDMNTAEGGYLFDLTLAQTQAGDAGNYGGSYKTILWSWTPTMGANTPYLMLHTSY